MEIFYEIFNLLELYVNIWSIVMFTGLLIFTAALYARYEVKNKLNKIGTFIQIATQVITLIVLLFSLSDLSNYEQLGSYLSFIILSNLYAAIFNLICRIKTIFNNSKIN